MFGPRQAILTLYGDYSLNRAGEIGVGSMVQLLSNFGLSERAVRSAISRMSRSGLLKVRRDKERSYYSLTRVGHSMLTEGARRIFEHRASDWDGTWSILTYSIPERRRDARDRLRVELGWLGYGPVSEATWVSPHDKTEEVAKLAGRLRIKECVHVFQAKHVGWTDPETLVRRCWDLPRIHQKYREFIAEYQPKLESLRKRLTSGEVIPASECFVDSFNIISEYRKLPFFDPDLPLELLPNNWLRPQAAALFDEYHGSLDKRANEYFDSMAKTYQSNNGFGRKVRLGQAIIPFQTEGSG